MPLKRSTNLFRGERDKLKNRRRKSIVTRLDILEPRLLLSAYVFADDFNTAVGSGPSSAWGKENTTDPNNGAVHYTNILPGQATGNNPSTMGVVSDPQALDGKALAMSLMPAPNSTGNYDSAEISTKLDPSNIANNLQYGHIEARIKLPGGNNSNAIWPAFWMLGNNIGSVGWPACGEMDIMENRGSEPGINHSTLHGPDSGGNDYNGNAGVSASYTLPGGASFYSAYHVFALDWGPNSVTFSIDGTPFYSFTPVNLPAGSVWDFNHPFYLILDVCEGGNFAPGTITSTQTMYVDYVHASVFSAAAAPPLSDLDIGSPAVAGSGYFDGITNTVNGGGTRIGGTSDQFNFDSQVLSGDATLITQVDWVTDSAQFAKGGLMIRDGTAANASYAYIQLNPYGGGSSGTGGATFEYRNGAGTTAQTASTDASANLLNGPIWLKLVRSGNTFSAFDSINGTTWNQIGPNETINISSSAQAGIAVDANSTSALSADTFSNVSILPGTFIDSNVGTPGRFGTGGFTNTTSTWNVGGGGAGITGTADQFNFASQSLTGDGSVIADVTSMTATMSLSAAGIMFRNDNTASSAFALLAETSGGGTVFEWRASAGATAQSTSVGTGGGWIKLLRSGNSFTAFYSGDDVNWSQLGTAQTVTMGSTALVGAAVTAGDNTGQLNVGTYSLLSVANAAAKLVYLTPPVSTTAGSAFPSNIVALIEDSTGRTVQSDASNVTISVASGTGALQGTLTVTAKNGMATFSNLAAAAPGTGGIKVADGSLTSATSSSITISNPTGVSPVGAATYAMSGYPGAQTMDVTGGVVNLTTDQSLNFPSMLLKIESGASVTLQADQHINGVQLVGTGSLNVNNCAMYINYGGAADPISTIIGYLQTGYNGGLWNGTGVFSTAAATNSGSYGLGYADSADTGNPAGLGTHTIKIMYTLLGDANLDAAVNGVDFGILSADFNKSASRWDQGDFNYDGAVNGIDFGFVAANFNQGAVGTAAQAGSTNSTTVNNDPSSTPTGKTNPVLTTKKPPQAKPHHHH
jgi:beta-glucanase (GH16 family)